MRPFRTGVGARHERGGRIGHVDEIAHAAEADVKPPTHERRLDRARGIARDPRVPPDAVHAERPQADRREPVIAKVHARVPFVRLLEHAVVRERFRRDALVDGLVGQPEYGRRARIHDALDPGRARRFEHVQRANDVDERAERRVRAARRYLQAGEVDDAPRA